MRVKSEKWIVMTFDGSRASIRAKQIGKGRWTTAYLENDSPSSPVYLFTAVRPDGGTDYAKEAIAGISREDRNPHVPHLERFDDIDGAAGERFHIYRSKFYYPLMAKCGKAWQQFKRLALIAEEENRQIVNALPWNARTGIASLGYDFMQAVIERARIAPESTPELVEALELIADAANNYGSTWWFEFAKRNCAVDRQGNLVLLDCVFDRQQVEREGAERRKRAGMGRF